MRDLHVTSLMIMSPCRHYNISVPVPSNPLPYHGSQQRGPHFPARHSNSRRRAGSKPRDRHRYNGRRLACGGLNAEHLTGHPRHKKHTPPQQRHRHAARGYSQLGYNFSMQRD